MTKPKPTKKDVPSISYFSLFRFASKKDKLFIVIAILATIVCGCTQPAALYLMTYFMQAMVTFGKSQADGTPQVNEFLKAMNCYAIFNAILGVAIIALTYISTVLMNLAAYHQVFVIRQEYLKAALNQDFEYFDTQQTGDFASKMSDDVIKLEEGIGEKVTSFLYYITAGLSCFSMALAMGWKLALLCMTTFPASIILITIVGLYTSWLSKKEMEILGRAGNVAEEVMSSIRTVYAFNGQKQESSRYQTILNETKKISVLKELFNGLSMGIIILCVFSSYGLAFWLGYTFMMKEPETYTVHNMMAVFFAVLTGGVQLGTCGIFVEVFGIGKGAGAHIFYLIDNVPKINPLLNRGGIPKEIGGIEIENVKFRYPSRPDVQVLKGVSISVGLGQSVALVGHSGCGKSTILQLISRYYDVTEGSVRLGNWDIRDISVRWLRSQIGLVGQEPMLFNTTVRENIRYGREGTTDAQIEEAARQANAHNFIEILPQGYDTQVGERGTSLSGGQKQRIAIARAIVRDPRILILDEATSALDTESEAIVQAALDKAQKGRTTIIVAHRLSTIRQVNIIYVFKDGLVIESGNHQQLMTLKGHYYEMVSIQGPEIQVKDYGLFNGSIESRTVSEISEKRKNVSFTAEIKAAEEEEIVRLPSFWRVLELNKPECLWIVVASVFALISGVGLPIAGLILGDFLGAVTDTKSGDHVIRLAVIFVIVGVCMGIGSFLQTFLYGLSGDKLAQRLRRDMFSKLLEQEVGYFDKRDNSVGALCARLSGEAALVQGATGQRIGSVIQAAGSIVFATIVSLYFEWRVGLVVLCFVPVMIILIYQQGKMLNAESFGTAKTMEKSSDLAVEAVTNARTVASLGREQRILQEYADQLLPAVTLANRSAHIRGLVFGASRGYINFIYSAAYYFGGWLIIYKGASLASVMQSAQALMMGASNSANALSFAPNFHKGILAAGRIIRFMDRKSEITDPKKPVFPFKGTGSASLQNVMFRYPTRPTIQVLNGLDLEILRGKSIALVGESGCGKSTIIQLLERYYDPDVGIVALDGIPLPLLRLADARETIGFVQQEPILFSRSIAENIAYGDTSRTPSMEEIVLAAETANIHSFIAALPLGYETRLGSKGTQLSGGQKQRVAIARALIRKPKMLLLDEATSALDTESEKMVQAALDNAKSGRTCVTIAHRLGTIRDADVICVVEGGVIKEQGTHAELMDNKGHYYNMNRVRQ